MTNCERYRRHLALSADCQTCPGFQESVLHILRDCPVASALWKALLPPNQWHDFFSASIEDWWWDNLQRSDHQDNFGLGCWVIWKARNQRVFNNDSISTEGLRAQVACWATTLLQCETEANELHQANSTVRTVREVAWEPQSEPWLTLNVDGSVNHAGQAAWGGGGGALRNHSGDCLLTFTANYGRCSITRAEMRRHC
ncbi:Putative ribonuclease H protein At1g65750 [Linum grandiflorum]